MRITQKTALFVLATLGMLNACSSAPTKKELSAKEQEGMMLDLATSSLADGDATSALVTLNEIHSKNPKSSQVHYLYALTYYKKGEIDLALNSAQKAIQLRPDFSQAKNALGKLFMEKGQYSKAIPLLKEAAADLTNRDSDLAETNLGLIYFNQGKSDLAEAHFTKAINQPGASICSAHYFRGKIRLEKNLTQIALKDFEKASRTQCAGMTDAHLAVGQTLIRLKKFDQARAKMVEIQRLFPDSDASQTATEWIREIP